MKPIAKLGCRVFQTGMRASIPVLPYRKPKPLSSVEDIPAVLKEHGLQRLLIVADPGVVQLGLIDHLERTLRDQGIPYAVFDRVVPNPTTYTVEAAKTVYYKNRCQAIVAVGGGSSIDCAKLLGIRVARPGTPLSACKGILKVMVPLPLIIAIPTTAGTGSETTLTAIVVDAETRHKYAIHDFPLIPRYAVLDPEMTLSLPPHLTASTGMDALTHAVEAYIGRSTTKQTRKDALAAVGIIFRNLDRAFENGSDLEARRNMLTAAYLAGCAFTVSYVGYIHAVAHALGGEYDVPHGLANAVILPLGLEKYGSVIHKKLKDLAIAAGVADRDTPVQEAAEAFIEAIRAMKRRYGIGDTIPELKRKDIPKLARYAAHEGNPLYPVPVIMDARELETIFEALLEEDSHV